MTNSSAVRFSVLLLSVVLFGCGSGGDDPQQAAVGSESAPEAQLDVYALLAQADIERGKMMYLQCRACHSLEQGGAHKVGPNLFGMFGSKAGFAAGFSYSEPMSNSDVVWSPETLDPWLRRPSEFIPGTRMVYVGIKNPQDRANLIAFLLTQTAPSGN
jgi:cytochrome c